MNAKAKCKFNIEYTKIEFTDEQIKQLEKQKEANKDAKP